VAERPEVVDHYGAHYRAFAAGVYGEVRRAAFGEDIGQNSWLTVDELGRFVSRLDLRPGTRLLDVCCGSGGPALHVGGRTGCEVVGVELSGEAVAEATRLADELSLDTRSSFVQADAGEPLLFDAGPFDALMCIDAINHLPDRARVLGDWARVLRSGGRLLAAAGLTVVDVEDTTDHLAEIAGRRRDARAARADALREIEGDAAFDGRQRFFELVGTPAGDRRLSRFVYTAEAST